MADLSTMPRAKLVRAIEKNDAERGELLTALIEAGFGACKYQDMMAIVPRTDLIERYRINNDQMRALHVEKEYRLHYQGTIHPVKKSAFA